MSSTIVQESKITLKSSSVSNDFTRHPPIEKFQTIDGLLTSHASEPEQPPLICYPRGLSAADFQEYTARDINSFAGVAAEFYCRNELKPVEQESDKPTVVALLASSNFEVILTIFALNRLGYAILFLSTRLTAAACARLLDMADCDTIIVPESRNVQVDDIRKERPACCRVPLLREQDYLVSTHEPVAVSESPARHQRGNKLAWILHSSGSTGFPKPIFLTNLQCLANFRKSFALRGFCWSPLFHSHGLMELFRAFYTRSTMYLGNYALPVTSHNLVAALRKANPELVCAVPYVLKLLAEKHEGIETLARAKLVLYAGSSCPDELGDRLVRNGVNLVANYGATETGQIMTSFRPPGNDEWQYMRMHRPVADHVLMDEIAPGVFECVGLHGLPSKCAVNAKPPYSKQNPENSFRTADLFTRHPDPSKPNFWKYLSRLDDRLTLVNGEKVLPIPIEGRIRQEDLVREAVVFGIERTVPGVLVFRSQDHETDLSEEDFLQAVWPAIESANMGAETFSRIPRELVVVKGMDVAYPKTDKGTFIRAQVYSAFAEDISRVYAEFEASSKSIGLLRLELVELEEWLLSKFREDLEIHLPSIDSDIFAAGVDSLQTMKIWRTIRTGLDLGDSGKSLSQNVVFETGTVRALARHLYGLMTSQSPAVANDETAIMSDLIQRYSTFTQHFAMTAVIPERDVVVVTGATGNLGAFIVAELLRRPSVAKVFALVRAPGQAAAGARVMHSLASRCIQLTDAELSKLYALPSDLSDPNLGLDKLWVQTLLSEVTSVIHSAWAVNFQISISSFDAQHIRGTYNLVNFCLRSQLPSPARLFFCSSISAVSGTPRPAIIRECIENDMRNAQATGYGRSKLVTEHIVRNAMDQTGIYARVLRIGQLCGDRVSGIWNETEAVALMIRSALTTGALPLLDETPSWLPVDECAELIADVAAQTSSTARATPSESEVDLVYHLVNPQTFHWQQDFLPALRRHPLMPAFETLGTQAWLSRLATSEQDPSKNPSIKLFSYWNLKYGAKAEAEPDEADQKSLNFETIRTAETCPSLAKVQDPVSEGLVSKYLDHWLKLWLSL